ncbi:MAG: hypothetical protein DRH57_05650 [Candidatus Cloacimonadota bacterium]|nr:MAG: hypothetical protein DRH57_05650 [Candidatus Cloacimonadota bacterium]
MPIPGSPNYRVGLIIARAQPFHNGLVKIIADAMMTCDDLIISFVNHDTGFFDYNHNQKMGRLMYGTNTDRDGYISYFGTEAKPFVITPKQILEETLTQLEVSNWNKPTHFYTHLEEWVTPAMELQLEVQHVSVLVNNNPNEILESFENDTDLWESKVPFRLLEEIKSYIATKRRNF